MEFEGTLLLANYFLLAASLVYDHYKERTEQLAQAFLSYAFLYPGAFFAYLFTLMLVSVSPGISFFTAWLLFVALGLIYLVIKSGRGLRGFLDYLNLIKAGGATFALYLISLIQEAVYVLSSNSIAALRELAFWYGFGLFFIFFVGMLLGFFISYVRFKKLGSKAAEEPNTVPNFRSKYWYSYSGRTVALMMGFLYCIWMIARIIRLGF
jgi:hypothetical protein